MRKLYIADLHLAHANVIKHDNRPFENVDQMNSRLIENWNNAVNADDEVYVLGDFAWKNAVGLQALMQLKGKKFLILGNHDKPTEEMRAYFGWVKDYAVTKDGERELVLCHYPIAHWYNQFRGTVHLYGHVHNNKDNAAYVRYGQMCREQGIPFEAYNVGCMMSYMDYTPRTLEYIINNACV